MQNDKEEIINLVIKAKQGDREDFSFIYSEFFNPIYRFIYFRVNSKVEAEDLAQTVFLKIWSALEKNKAALNEKLLVNFLSAIKEEVTTSEENRLIFRDDKTKSPTYIYVGDKGRVSVNNDQIHNFMVINWKKLVFGVFILAVVASVSYYQFVLKVPSETVEIAKVSTEANIVPATGNVDDATLALLNDADAEIAILANIEKDANLIIADNQAINDFGQSYNEEF